MNKNFILGLVFLTLSLSMVQGYVFEFDNNHQLEYDYFMDVGETNRIWFHNNYTNESTIEMTFNATSYPMNWDLATESFYIDVVSSVEDDVSFNVFEFQTNTTHEFPTSSADLEEDFIISNTTSVLSFRYNVTGHDVKTEGHLTCATLKKHNLNRNVVFMVGVDYNNGSGIIWSESNEVTIDDTSYQNYCEVVDVDILNDSFTYYFGLKCKADCTSSKPLYLGVDTNGTRIYDSYYFHNESENGANYTTGNFLISTFEDVEDVLLGNVPGTMRFRIPFWYTFEMWYSNGTGTEPQQYLNDFNYVYVNFRNETFNSVPSTQAVNKFFDKTLGWLPGLDAIYGSSLDTELVMWGDHADGSGSIKLYEAGYYDINLLTHATLGSTWGEEFYKPQQGKIELDNQITYLNITSETNSTILIFADKWEFDKVSVVVNIFKTLIITFAIIVMLGMLTFLPGGSKLVGLAVPIIVALLFKIFGWI